MPLMSPARTPGASSFRSVLPPSMKKLPSRMRLSGVAPRWWTKGSSAARAFERTIARELVQPRAGVGAKERGEAEAAGLAPTRPGGGRGAGRCRCVRHAVTELGRAVEDRQVPAVAAGQEGADPRHRPVEVEERRPP